ncbi:MAG: hypothetical protein IPO22_02030 [Anaerolineales bacterium]|nr:hypothetical protein [Anaerolineales bacterium]
MQIHTQKTGCIKILWPFCMGLARLVAPLFAGWLLAMGTSPWRNDLSLGYSAMPVRSIIFIPCKFQNRKKAKASIDFQGNIPNFTFKGNLPWFYAAIAFYRSGRSCRWLRLVTFFKIPAGKRTWQQPKPPLFFALLMLGRLGAASSNIAWDIYGSILFCIHRQLDLHHHWHIHELFSFSFESGFFFSITSTFSQRLGKR